ncbi:uncharacterized protein PADG_12346 [Paracoccidioides brasiliensis Pb18]|uniref:Septin-type G domain-containing protein n=1 Tax=Paracoccidioides brasiliensis (strain Pb18) TaxID=502780 RepID=A0A0A0HU78_PARBD|nr:uncharacterized protein PADG_12346 [Paracoccidioides brasiliensis Pb18]KGM91571.1 hypothetical protein PADG_12346 [Paracoccidioides brasiliensis Pb18]
MRPAVPDTYLLRPRKSPSPGAAEDHPRHSSPETFFLTRDSDLQDSQTAPTSGAETKDGSYDVRSLEESLLEEPHVDSPTPRAGGCPIKWPNSLLEKETDGGPTLHIPRKMPATKPIESSDGDHEGLNPSVPSSLPLTPYSPNSPIESSSLQSSPKSMSMRSFRQADGISTHDGGNKRSTGAAETEGGSGSCLLESSEIQDSTPQLIMPSIQMPSRRPFTEKGKSIGKFKILIAGAAGSGKTSLIKSIVQIFEDIVHVDPLPRRPSRPDAGRASSRPGSKRLSRTHHHDRESTSLVEIYASTKPYPSWWSDLEDSRVLRRRKSMGDFVLERNLCFVDTTSGALGLLDQAECIVQYLGQQFQRAVTALDSINSDFLGLLSGNGGSQVDAILYLVSKDSFAADIACIRKLSTYANVIPLIAKADLLSETEIQQLKRSFLSQAQEADVRPFLFGDFTAAREGDEAAATTTTAKTTTTTTTSPSLPFAVSSANSHDDDNMDASLLMSPEYRQPILAPPPRHEKANPILPPPPPTPQQPANHASPAPPNPKKSLICAQISERNRIWDPQKEKAIFLYDRLAHEDTNFGLDGAKNTLPSSAWQKWAADLQQSLQNERERYETLARSERAVWLAERLGECVVDGTLVPISRTPGFEGPCGSCNSSGMRKGMGKGGEDGDGDGDGDGGGDRGRGRGQGRGAGGGEMVTVYGPDGRRRRGRRRVGGYQVHAGGDVMRVMDPLGLIGWNDEVRQRGWVVVRVLGGVGVFGGIALWVVRGWNVGWFGWG